MNVYVLTVPEEDPPIVGVYSSALAAEQDAEFWGTDFDIYEVELTH